MRHTAATWAAQDGTEIWEIANMLGHTNIRTTQRYMKHHPDYQSRAVGALERRLRISDAPIRSQSADANKHSNPEVIDNNEKNGGRAQTRTGDLYDVNVAL